MQRVIDPTHARRFILSRQHLDGASRPDMLNVIHDIGCLQLDPISAVARSHQIVLFSRLGNYDTADFEQLLWDERHLFEYWAHEASIVLTQDYPIHHWRMRRYGKGKYKDHFDEFLAKVEPLRQQILERLREEGPLLTREFNHDSRSGGMSSGWTSGRDVNKVIDYLWQSGEVMVAGRQGIQRQWDLAERCLPEWTPREQLDARTVTERAVRRALAALGIATPMQIKRHFTRRRYPRLKDAIAHMEAEGEIIPVTVDGWRGDDWYMLAELLPQLEEIERDNWAGKVTLLSPFDNLICDRARTETLFDFTFRIEIYVPADKREYGYYVLPLLENDRFIGRIDPRYDRKKRVLTVNNIYREPDASRSKRTARRVRRAIDALGEWLGAETIDIGTVPDEWAAIR